jgi:hypothetical protein
MKRYFLMFFSLHYLFVWVPSAVGQASQTADYKWQSDNRGGVTITVYVGINRAITIPNSINGNPVTSIGVSAFSRKQLTGVTIPNSVTSIEEYAFYNNQLTSITIPGSVTSIGESAFAHNQLTSVTIGANLMLNAWKNPFGSEGLVDAYNSAGRQSGTYTRPNADSTTWTRR